MRLLVIAMLLVAMLAGCAGGEYVAPTGARAPADVAVVEEEDLDVSWEDGGNETLGDLRFIIATNFSSALAGVEVLILSVSGSQFSDDKGRVEFLNMPPGEYNVRFEATGYQSQLVTVDVVAGLRKDVKITMDIDQGFLTPPHRHDLWQGRETVTIVERDEWDFTCIVNTNECIGDDSRASGSPRYHLPDEAIIFPGTGRVDILIEGDDPTPAPISVYRTWPGPNGFQGRTESYTLGSPNEITITRNETDVPHAKKSMWELMLQTPLTSERRTWVGPFQVTITIHSDGKPLPLDPPHPDHWGGATQIILTDVDVSGTLASVGPLGQPSLPANKGFDAGKLVFPGTTTVRFDAWINYSVSTGPVHLEVNPVGNKNGQQYVAGIVLRPPDSVSGTLHRWEFNIPSAWWDPIYLSQSQWSWRLAPSRDAAVPDAQVYSGHMVVTALRDG